MNRKVLAVSLISSLVLTTTLLATLQGNAADPSDPELAQVFVETGENNGICGDCILVIYDQPMLIETSPHPLAGGMEDVNNVPGSELEAPAEYPHHQGNATKKKTAKP